MLSYKKIMLSYKTYEGLHMKQFVTDNIEIPQ